MTRLGPMRIGVDARPLLYPRSGVGRYTAELLRASSRLAEHHRYVLATAQHPSKLATQVDDLPRSNVTVAAPYPHRRIAFKVLSKARTFDDFRLLTGPVDAFFFPNYRRFQTGGAPALTVIYDLGFLYVPGTIHPGYLSRLTRDATRAIDESAAIGTISETVATELRTEFPQAEGRIVVLRPGVSTGLGRATSRAHEKIAMLDLEPGYFLFVGSLEPRKNLGTLLEAFARLDDIFVRKHPLVVVGPPGWSNEGLLARAAELDDRVRLLSFVDDAVLRSLYEFSAAFVFPSRYEGFGLPILEAMSIGVPVICSDIPVFHEVAADAALYFDPQDPDAIAASLRLAAVDPDLRSSLVARGLERCRDFSWDSTARTFIDVMETLPSGSL